MSSVGRRRDLAALRQETIEAAAPDQASLAVAVKLLKPALWSNGGGSEDAGLVRGDCQGSGANPYRLAVDLVEIGSKCTCPSRKFPCKHALALMLMQSRGQTFAAADVPPWVVEWMGRRKGGAIGTAPAAGTSSPAAVLDEADNAPDPKAGARREAQRARGEAEIAGEIRAGLSDLEGWISDQLRGGLSTLLANLPARCRQVAARMVDARMGALAARVDEIPARIQTLPVARRMHALVSELGNLVLMSRASGDGTAPDPGLRRQIASTEPHEALLADPSALRVTALWSVCATREVTCRDGLVAQSTCLANRSAGPAFALLQDYLPASAGRRSAAFVEGEAFGAELVFYPLAHPLRAQIVQRCGVSASGQLPPAPQDLLDAYASALGREPWVTEVPLMLPAGRLAQAKDGTI
jgi:SWIM zinc finger